MTVRWKSPLIKRSRNFLIEGYKTRVNSILPDIRIDKVSKEENLVTIHGLEDYEEYSIVIETIIHAIDGIEERMKNLGLVQSITGKLTSKNLAFLYF